MRRLTAPVTTAALAVVIAAAAALWGTVGLVFALLAIVVVFAGGWPALLRLPTQRGSTTILALCGALAVLVVALTSGVGVDVGLEQPSPQLATGPSERLRWLVPVLAMSVVIAFTHQLMRRDFRPRLVESVTGVIAGVVVISMSSGWLAAATIPDGDALIHTAVVAILASTATLLLPFPVRYTGPLAIVVAAGLSGLVAKLVEHSDQWAGLGAGALIGILAVGLHQAFRTLPPSASRASAFAQGATLACAAGSITYLTAGLF